MKSDYVDKADGEMRMKWKTNMPFGWSKVKWQVTSNARTWFIISRFNLSVHNQACSALQNGGIVHIGKFCFPVLYQYFLSTLAFYSLVTKSRKKKKKKKKNLPLKKKHVAATSVRMELWSLQKRFSRVPFVQ
jgi:hypothetical protein